MRVGDALRVTCQRLAFDLQEDRERLGEHEELTASMENATMGASSDTTLQSHSSDSSVYYGILSILYIIYYLILSYLILYYIYYIYYIIL